MGWSTLGTVAYITITGSGTTHHLWSIVQVYSRMVRDIIAAERLYLLLCEPVLVRNDGQGIVPTVSCGALSLDGVTLQYQEKDKPLFRNFDLSITPGEMIAFVGKSGSGKSSLISLLLRVYDPSSGAVRIDGVDIRELDRDWYRKRFAYVPQDVEIFDGTIRENIIYADPDASAQLVEKAVQAACLAESLADHGRFPRGLETQVGERGVRLSGGERQRVGIARAYVALLTGAHVLVLDEATSSLDSESEHVVQFFIQKLRREKRFTIVVIAHRLSTIQEADRICVLESGTIAEVGTHAELLRRNGLYQKLVALQQLGELTE
jgi:ABC-type multidrug transport system fused ATPase/permease subunit